MRSALTLLLLTSLISLSSVGQCEKMKGGDLRKLVGNFLYDSFRQTNIVAYGRGATIEYQVNLFRGTRYNLVFDTRMMDPKVRCFIYESVKGEKGKELFSSEGKSISDLGTLNHVITADQSQRILIRYEVPRGSRDGCVNMVLGFIDAPRSAPQNNKKKKYKPKR